MCIMSRLIHKYVCNLCVGLLGVCVEVVRVHVCICVAVYVCVEVGVSMCVAVCVCGYGGVCLCVPIFVLLIS